VTQKADEASKRRDAYFLHRLPFSGKLAANPKFESSILLRECPQLARAAAFLDANMQELCITLRKHLNSGKYDFKFRPIRGLGLQVTSLMQPPNVVPFRRPIVMQTEAGIKRRLQVLNFEHPGLQTASDLRIGDYIVQVNYYDVRADAQALQMSCDWEARSCLRVASILQNRLHASLILWRMSTDGILSDGADGAWLPYFGAMRSTFEMRVLLANLLTLEN